ncbi:pyridine nucleotide-disulfide oxidoreductase [Hirsutella rhossiliensis]|uniref:Pyridine nucleotide-disulfide oxidoreductase domain-containing protein n=1 Tax=Hirsutella rhossiliensis TaxID=111463 RepID=A0A9P8MYF2_9HYPO|nr:pyridine nucleotide-disulfide oxidoreductase domain-containing protein [Hirsutella rhossiliensis]KAH0963580.1 pyridine nucleotide-disulfide oxidoreductase domain-containing protein [Hirsutella rhossiliensis]
MWLTKSRLLLFVFSLAAASPAPCNFSAPAVWAVYDVIVVGGGPSGIAALSALARVGRRALMLDSAEYRNARTRRMHDVPGSDGVTPSYFRWAAMQQIRRYGTVQGTNGTVVEIRSSADDEFFTADVRLFNNTCASYTARKIILGTGLRDLLPQTPGLEENFGKGIYWCPWCDGMEHAGQPMGILGSFEQAVGAVGEVRTLHSDIIVFANGTDTPENRARADKTFAPNSSAYLQKLKVKVDNRTITGITRLRDGADAHADPKLPSNPEHDLFDVELAGSSGVERVQRAVLFANYPSGQRSTLGKNTGVELRSDRMAVDSNMRTRVPGIYAVGDANSDGSTNVLHALYTGKRAVVDIHVELEKQVSKDLVARASKGDDEEALRRLWTRVNGEPGDLLYAGEYR